MLKASQANPSIFGVMCWGNGANKRLGDGSSSPQSYPVFVLQAAKQPLWGAVQVVAGGGHSCVLMNNQSVQCWGSYEKGQLGVNGASTWLSIPKDSSGNPLMDVNAVVLGNNHTCVLIHGKVGCFGDNSLGQLGDGSGVNSFSLVWVSDENGQSIDEITQISAKGDQSCAVTVQHTLWCWGKNTDRQLGTGDSDGFMYAVRVKIDNQHYLKGVNYVAVGGDHVCAIVGTARNLYCWGKNSYGELGLGHTKGVVFPTPITQ
jgi:alpha-tubulin suppressor-like RCC1 family protein